MGKILNGKELAARLNSELKNKINLDYQRTGIRPKLAAILVGNDPCLLYTSPSPRDRS